MKLLQKSVTSCFLVMKYQKIVRNPKDEEISLCCPASLTAQLTLPLSVKAMG